MSTYQFVGDALIIVSAAEADLFVLLYSLSSRWWKSVAGWNIMTLMFVIAAILDMSSVRLIVGVSADTPWFISLRLAVFMGVPFVLAWWLWRLVKIQLIDRNRDYEDQPHQGDQHVGPR